MNDLISRAEAMRTYQNICYGISCDECKAKETDGTCRLEKWVRTLPTAHRPVDEWCVDCKEYDHDKHCCPRFNRVIRTAVDERKNGKWIVHENQRQEDVDNGNYLYVCSECGKSDIHAKTQNVPFCWWCGARMDGDGNG